MNEKNTVRCFICDKEFKSITATHLKKHNITMKNYMIEFPDSQIRSDNSLAILSSKMKGREICL